MNSIIGDVILFVLLLATVAGATFSVVYLLVTGHYIWAGLAFLAFILAIVAFDAHIKRTV